MVSDQLFQNQFQILNKKEVKNDNISNLKKKQKKSSNNITEL